jgi:cytidylate kinase
MLNQKIPVITIDGPGGTGKGTIGMRLAQHLGWHFLDSGMLYRAVAKQALQKNLPLDDAAQLICLIAELPIEFRADGDGVETQVYLDGENQTDQLRTEACGNAASKIAALSEVRDALLDLQRSYRKLPGLVTDGRDMGTIIFPDAPCKIFLTAKPEVRAQRRYHQLKNKGLDASLSGLLNEIVARDQRDQNRHVAPLQPALDAITLDTSDDSVDEVFAKVLRIVDKALALS